MPQLRVCLGGAFRQQGFEALAASAQAAVFSLSCPNPGLAVTFSRISQS